MAKCDRVRMALADYVEGSLRGRARARVEAHLRGCADCRAEVAALERTGELLRETRVIPAPGRLWGSIEAEIARRESVPVIRGLQHLWRGAVAAAALAAVLIGIWMVRPQEAPIAAPTVQQVAIDEEFQSTLEGHLSAIWVTPLADEAALGLQMGAPGEEG